MRWVSRLVQAALIVALAGAVVTWVVYRVRGPTVGGAFHTWADFRDASRLPVGSRVMTRGVHVGEITRLEIEGRVARVHLRLADDLELWTNAWAEKRAASLFGDGYIELHPGEPGPGVRRLAPGEPIPRVVDSLSTDRTLREVDQALPRAAEAMRTAAAFLDETRRQVAGPLRDRLDELDRTVKDAALAAPLHRADEAVGRFEAEVERAALALDGQAPRVHRALDRFATDVAGVTRDLRAGRADLEEALGGARARMDEIDPYLADAAEVVARLDGRAPPADQGTLGRLINDPSLGDTLHDAAEAGVDFTGSLARLRTRFGLRVELSVYARAPRIYVQAEVAGRHDSFYFLELARDWIGDLPDVALADDPGGPYVRTATIYDRQRLTFQWGRRFGPTSLRIGLKEGTFGIGANTRPLGGDRVDVGADLYGASFSREPRLKLTAAVRVVRSLFLLAGVDDIFREGGYLPVAPWPPGEDVPIWFEEVRYGRDVFFGAALLYHDADLEELLFLYGAALLGLL